MSRKTSRKSVQISDFYCTECGEKGINIPRIPGRYRELGHLKKIYCLKCQKETNHAEVRPFGGYRANDFREEFELGRFVDGKRIPISELIQCPNQECKYNKIGRCWNATNNFKCNYKKHFK